MVSTQITIEVKCLRIDKIGDKWLTGFVPARREATEETPVLGPNGFSVTTLTEPHFQRGRFYDLIIRESED